jgi:wyosine [tRNA(Phe)-imidazoG37] synthetase (radical SAM superfamily)
LSSPGADLSRRLRRDKEDRATNESRYIFGPVHSGRLGLSLGLDLLGARICTFDCLYCEAGATDALTVSRKPYVPAERILDELAAFKAAGPGRFDVVTLGGMGEPTLNTDCGAIIAGAKELFPNVPVAVLTNSSLLSDPQVRADLAGADIVLPSMDTLITAEYRRLNRPHASMDLDAIRRGLLDFRAGFSGAIYLEILLLAGVNDTEENLEQLRAFCRQLAPTRVDVVTMSRPGAHAGAHAVAPETLARFREALGVARPASDGTAGEGHGPAALRAHATDDLAARIAASVARRPQTAQDMSLALGQPVAAVQAALDALERRGDVRRELSGGEIFYSGTAG